MSTTPGELTTSWAPWRPPPTSRRRTSPSSGSWRRAARPRTSQTSSQTSPRGRGPRWPPTSRSPCPGCCSSSSCALLRISSSVAASLLDTWIKWYIKMNKWYLPCLLCSCQDATAVSRPAPDLEARHGSGRWYSLIYNLSKKKSYIQTFCRPTFKWRGNIGHWTHALRRFCIFRSKYLNIGFKCTWILFNFFYTSKVSKLLEHCNIALHCRIITNLSSILKSRSGFSNIYI